MSRNPGRSYHLREWQGAGMPLRSYILSVGGVLLALLFVANTLLPEPSVTGIVSGTEPPRIRIYSERKGPEAIVFDTSLPTIVPPLAARQKAPVAEASVASTEQAVRNSFAQVAPAPPPQIAGSEPRKVSAKHPRKREFTVARARRAPRFAAEYTRLDFFRMTW